MSDNDDKTKKADRVDRKLTEIGSSLSDLLRNIRERRMTLRQIRDELDAVRAQHDPTPGIEDAGVAVAEEAANGDAAETPVEPSESAAKPPPEE